MGQVKILFLIFFGWRITFVIKFVPTFGRYKDSKVIQQNPFEGTFTKFSVTSQQVKISFLNNTVRFSYQQIKSSNDNYQDSKVTGETFCISFPAFQTKTCPLSGEISNIYLSIKNNPYFSKNKKSNKFPHQPCVQNDYFSKLKRSVQDQLYAYRLLRTNRW